MILHFFENQNTRKNREKANPKFENIFIVLSRFLHITVISSAQEKKIFGKLTLEMNETNDITENAKEIYTPNYIIKLNK